MGKTPDSPTRHRFDQRDEQRAAEGNRQRDGGLLYSSSARDVAVALLLAIALEVNLALRLAVELDPGESVAQIGFILTAAAALSLAIRTRAPLTSLALSTAFVVAYFSSGQPEQPIVICAFIAMYSVVLSGDRRRSLIIGAVMATILVVNQAVFDTEDGRHPTALLGALALAAVPVVLGDAVRNRRAYLREARERAERERLAQLADAERAVQEERLRIARDLHDVVAHSIAMINIQAGVAAHVLHDRPEQGREALTHIKEASKTALDELRTLLSVLRDDERSSESTHAPVATLSLLDTLVETLRSTGTSVELNTSGDLDALPIAVSIAGYRIVQEATTNAVRHAPRQPVSIDVDAAADGVSLTVSNPINAGGRVDASSPDRSHADDRGFGIIGMTERASAIGGVLSAGPTLEGRWAVSASLPFDQSTMHSGRSHDGLVTR